MFASIAVTQRYRMPFAARSITSNENTLRGYGFSVRASSGERKGSEMFEILEWSDWILFGGYTYIHSDGTVRLATYAPFQFNLVLVVIIIIYFMNRLDKGREME